MARCKSYQDTDTHKCPNNFVDTSYYSLFTMQKEVTTACVLGTSLKFSRCTTGTHLFHKHIVFRPPNRRLSQYTNVQKLTACTIHAKLATFVSPIFNFHLDINQVPFWYEYITNPNDLTLRHFEDGQCKDLPDIIKYCALVVTLWIEI